MFFFFFKQKTAYEMRISDWSSDVCSSDLHQAARLAALQADLEAALQALVAMRAAEGARLLAMARGHIDEIERLAEAARGCAATQPQALRQRLTAQLALLLEESAGVSEDRPAQALALLAGTRSGERRVGKVCVRTC